MKSDGIRKTGGFELTRAAGKTEARPLDEAEKEKVSDPKTGSPSVGVQNGPQGTKRLVPATTERPTVAPTRRPKSGDDKSKSTGSARGDAAAEYVRSRRPARS